MNIKKVTLWLAIIMVISFSASALLFSSAGVSFSDFWVFDHSKENNLKYESNIKDEKSLSINGIEKLEISTISSDIKIVIEDREDIKADFYGYVNHSNGPKLVTNKMGNTLAINIKYPSNINLGMNITNLKLDIYLPKSFSKKISIKTTSADVDMQGVQPESFEFKSISGNLEAESILSKDSNIETTSGDVTIDAFTGDLSYKSVSGDLFINYNIFQDNHINLKSTSGDINVGLPEGSNFDLDANTVSGDIDCEFPVTLKGSISKKNIEGKVGEGNNSIKASTVSGDVDISKNEQGIKSF